MKPVSTTAKQLSRTSLPQFAFPFRTTLVSSQPACLWRKWLCVRYFSIPAMVYFSLMKSQREKILRPAPADRVVQ
jgi:hypothetical protein